MSAHHRTSSWAKVTRVQKPRIQATLPAPCIEPGCRHLIEPEDLWDLGHIISVDQALAMGWTPQMIDDPSNLGPACRRGNRSNGGKAGRAKQVAASKQRRRLPSW